MSEPTVRIAPYTRADIERLAANDPVVRVHLTMRAIAERSGADGAGWEEMLHGLVFALVEAKDRTMAYALELANRTPAPLLIPAKTPPEDS